MRVTSSRLILVLLSLFCVFSFTLSDETATATDDAIAVDDAAASEDVVVDPDADNDDGDFDVTDLLPGLENVDSDSFVKNYIMGNPEWYQKPFDPPPMVHTFNSLPRFSHSDDFSLLLGDSPDDYFLGLLFVGCFIVSVFVFWGISICVLKCIGPKHVGVLAGFPFREEGKKSIAGRIVLAVSAWFMIVSTIVLITKGLAELQIMSDQVGVTARDIQMIEVEVQNIVTNLLVVSAKTLPIRDELVDFLKRDICPLEPGSDTEDQVRDVGEDTYDAMVDLDDFIEGYLTDVESGVEFCNKFTDRVLGLVKRAQFVDNPKVTIIVFPYFIVPAFLIVAVGMGWYDVFSEGFYTFITWIILPLMIFLTAFAIIAAGWMVIAIEANSDLCSPTPEDTILNILDSLDLEDDSGSGSKDENGPSDNFFYDIMVFYTYQCTTANPWQFLEGHYADLARGRNILGEFLRSIADTTLQQLSQECGHEYAPIVTLLTALQDQITILSKTSIRALNLMSCRNIVPLYTAAVYDATCNYSIVGQTWVFSCTCCIAFFGMMCIMFRGAYYPIEYYYYDATGEGNKEDLYPQTDDDSGEGIEQVLADTDCNALILEEQEEQCVEAIETMEKDGDVDVYEDDEKKEDDEDDEDEDDEDYDDEDGNDDEDDDDDEDNFDDEDSKNFSIQGYDIGRDDGHDSSTKEMSSSD